MNPLVFLGGAAAVLLLSGKKSRSGKPSRKCPELQPGSGNIAGFKYIETTTGGASLNERLPIIVHFHSLGSKPDGFIEWYEDIPEKARVILPYGRDRYGSGPSWWPLRSKTKDQDGLAQMMRSEARAMVDFVEAANDCLGGVGRPVITGHSQGGMMTYAVAAESPNSVRAAVPVSGWLPVKLWPRELPPTHAIHGMNDLTVNFKRTEDFITRAKEYGLPIEWSPVQGRGHGFGGEVRDIWTKDIRTLLTR